jgi:hypothetical protein
MTCSTCAHWITTRKTVYGDGSEVVTYQCPDGKGRCEKLEIDTPAEFGCAVFVEGQNPVRISEKPGAPWQFWEMVPCPVCAQKGLPPDGAKCQCAGTGKVRRYDDGFIGDERTRLHPKERELDLAPKPHCSGCSREVEIMWVACPYCGGRLEPPAKTEVVSDPMGGTNATPELMAKAVSDRQESAATEVDASSRPQIGPDIRGA